MWIARRNQGLGFALTNREAEPSRFTVFQQEVASGEIGDSYSRKQWLVADVSASLDLDVDVNLRGSAGYEESERRAQDGDALHGLERRLFGVGRRGAADGAEAKPVFDLTGIVACAFVKGLLVRDW